MTSIHFIGTGTMGSRMLRRLSRKGYSLRLSDADESAARSLATETGAEFIKDPAGCAPADYFILMLPNSEIVNAVLGDDGDPHALAAQLTPGTTIIDMSSSEPAATQALAARFRERNVAFIDAPVSGGPSKAATGELAIMVGTTDTEEFERVLPLLKNMGTAVTRAGSPGSGHALKALNNLLAVVGLVGALEVLAVGRRMGLDPQVMLDVINQSTGRNHATEVKVGQQVLTRDWGVGFSLQLTVKDVTTAMKLADNLDVNAPVSAAASEIASKALQMFNGQTADQSQIAEYIESLNHIKFS